MQRSANRIGLPVLRGRAVPFHVGLVHRGDSAHAGYAEPSLTVGMTSEPWRVRAERTVPLW